MVIVGLLMAAIGLVIAFGFGVETCSGGIDTSVCTSGPMPQTLAIGLVLTVAGAVVAYRGATRRNHEPPN